MPTSFECRLSCRLAGDERHTLHLALGEVSVLAEHRPEFQSTLFTRDGDVEHVTFDVQAPDASGARRVVADAIGEIRQALRDRAESPC